MFDKIRARWKLAGILERAQRNGQSVITVPFSLAAEVQAYIWQRKIQIAQAKWDARVSEVSPTDWQAAMRKATSERTEPGS